MKFSFESAEYRKNLADQIKEEKKVDKDTAKELLEKEQDTRRYIVSRDIKNVLRVVNKRKTETRKDNIEVPETRKDGDWLEHGLNGEVNVEVFDIQDKIPEELKLFLDQIRLQEININLKGFNIEGDHRVYGSAINHIQIGEPENIAAIINDKVNPEYYKMFKKIYKAVLGREYNSNNNTDHDQFDELDEMYEEIKKQEKHIYTIAKNFINEITYGYFYDQNTLSHVVGGEIEEGTLRNRYPHSKNEELLKEEVFEDFVFERLWFTSKGATWFNIRKVLVLCNSKNKRFQKEVVGTNGYDENAKYRKESEERNKLPVPEMLQEAIKFAGGMGGVEITFNRRESLRDIADWIVDLYHGKLYKIVDREEK